MCQKTNVRLVSLVCAYLLWLLLSLFLPFHFILYKYHIALGFFSCSLMCMCMGEMGSIRLIEFSLFCAATHVTFSSGRCMLFYLFRCYLPFCMHSWPKISECNQYLYSLHEKAVSLSFHVIIVYYLIPSLKTYMHKISQYLWHCFIQSVLHLFLHFLYFHFFIVGLISFFLRNIL